MQIYQLLKAKFRKARMLRLPNIRKLLPLEPCKPVMWVLAGLVLLQSAPARAQCTGPYLTDMQRTLDVEGEKSEKFRTGNKPVIAKLLAARAKAGPRNRLPTPSSTRSSHVG
jgi:hypothetical protein